MPVTVSEESPKKLDVCDPGHPADRLNDGLPAIDNRLHPILDKKRKRRSCRTKMVEGIVWLMIKCSVNQAGHFYSAAHVLPSEPRKTTAAIRFSAGLRCRHSRSGKSDAVSSCNTVQGGTTVTEGCSRYWNWYLHLNRFQLSTGSEHRCRNEIVYDNLFQIYTVSRKRNRYTIYDRNGKSKRILT